MREILKEKIGLWLVLAIIAFAASVPALAVAYSHAKAIEDTRVVTRIVACEASMSQVARQHNGTFLSNQLRINAASEAIVADVTAAVAFCGDYTIDYFCAGQDCNGSALTLILK